MPERQAHIVFLVSAHGLGHLGQVAAVVESLVTLAPELRLSLASSIDPQRVAEFVPASVHIIKAPAHATIAMNGPLEVDVEETERGFQQWHNDIDQHISELSDWLTALQPNLVVSDVDYTVFPAARHCGIPAFAMCSLNWSEILRPMLPVTASNLALCEAIDRYYNLADRFLALEPAMPMPALDNAQQMPFVARRGNPSGVRESLGMTDDQQLILYTMGGVEQVLSVRHWQVPDDTVWVLPDKLAIDEPWCISQQDCEHSYIDLLAAADVLCTKPGYGSFTEACVNDTAVLYVRRHGWSEEAVLLEWLQQFDRSLCMSHEAFAKGDFRQPLEQLLQQKNPSALPTWGNDLLARTLLQALQS